MIPQINYLEFLGKINLDLKKYSPSLELKHVTSFPNINASTEKTRSWSYGTVDLKSILDNGGQWQCKSNLLSNEDSNCFQYFYMRRNGLTLYFLCTYYLGTSNAEKLNPFESRWHKTKVRGDFNFIYKIINLQNPKPVITDIQKELDDLKIKMSKRIGLDSKKEGKLQAIITEIEQQLSVEHLGDLKFKNDVLNFSLNSKDTRNTAFSFGYDFRINNIKVSLPYEYYNVSTIINLVKEAEIKHSKKHAASITKMNLPKGWTVDESLYGNILQISISAGEFSFTIRSESFEDSKEAVEAFMRYIDKINKYKDIADRFGVKYKIHNKDDYMVFNFNSDKSYSISNDMNEAAEDFANEVGYPDTYVPYKAQVPVRVREPGVIVKGYNRITYFGLEV